MKRAAKDLTTVAEFTVSEGERVPFVLTWFASHKNPPRAIHHEHALRDTEKYWREWCNQFQRLWEMARRSDAFAHRAQGIDLCAYRGPCGRRYDVVTGTNRRTAKLGLSLLLAARRYVRLLSLLRAGHRQEAEGWREWLLRAVAGSPAQMQIMYGVSGERRLTEVEIPWLSGYENSVPVRIGNAASTQFQLDVYGEVLATMFERIALE